MKRVMATIAALALLVLAAMPANAAAGGDATIQGTLVNGTTNEPIAGESVSLSQANVQTQQPNENMDQATTDARGRFEFSVPAGDQYMYDVSVNYQDVDYLSKALTPKAGETVAVKLTAYDSSESPKNMSISSWVVYLDKDPGGVAVEQSVTYVNSGKTTYPGIAMPGSKDHLSVELPVATTAVENSQQTDGFFAQCCSGVVDGTFGFTAPFIPGSSEGILRYVSTSPLSLSFPAQFPTTTFTMYVAPEITVTSTEGLTQAGTESLPGGGPSPSPIVYTKYTASNLAASQTVGAETTMAADKPPTLALILLALAGLAALFVVVVRLRLAAQKPKPSGGPRRATSSQPVRRKPSKPKQPSRSEHHSEAEVDADLLIAEIAALDVSFDQGLIQEEDYKKIRAARKAQLLDARKEDDGG